jgi:PDDEXK-like domain of unknown function (DUF3799)
MSAPVVISEPGVYDIPEDAYHADPVPGGSLSASGAKKLLACPARYDYDRRHPPQPTAAMEFGTAVHKLVLGKGPDLVVVEAGNWRTKAAQDKARDARAAGKVPLLAADAERAAGVAGAVLSHPVAGRLFGPADGGAPERSLFWADEATGVMRRARLDWLPGAAHGRMIVPDLKTSHSADPAAIPRAVASYGYHIQAAWYLEGVRALGLSADAAFLLVFAETAEPCPVTVVQLDTEAMAAGAALGQHACERWRDCTETGEWPGYTTDIELISLPPWTLRQLETL